MSSLCVNFWRSYASWLLSFWLHCCCGEREGGPVNQVNHTSWVTVVNSTDRPKSIRSCCLIELFYGVVSVVTLPFCYFCWCRGICHRTGSDLLLFVYRKVTCMWRAGIWQDTLGSFGSFGVIIYLISVHASDVDRFTYSLSHKLQLNSFPLWLKQ